VDVDAVVTQVRPIVDAVRERGTEAVLEFAERFDRVRPTGIRVPVQTLNGALAALDPTVRAALEVAIERARKVHADQRRPTSPRRWCRAAPSPSGSCRCAAWGSTRRAGWPSTPRAWS
jgi:histidinol dehydrogenase